MGNHLRILLIRISSIGDVLHCTPIARALKSAKPTWNVTWLVDEQPAELLVTNPYIDHVYIWPRARWEAYLRRGDWRSASTLWRQLIRDVRAAHYDIVLDAHGLFITGLIAWLSGAPRRIGMSGTRELNHVFMTEVAPELDANAHVIERYLNVVTPVGIRSHDYQMTLYPSLAADRFARDFLQQHNVQPDDALVVISPATSWPTKNWPAAYYATVARLISSRARVMLCGSCADRNVADQIIAGARVAVIDAVGKTDLLELAALLSHSQVLVSGDSGPLHMAVAVGIPTISVFGPTDVRHFRPLTGHHIVLQGRSACQPCHKRRCLRDQADCMQSIVPSHVMYHLLQILGKPCIYGVPAHSYHDRDRHI